MTTQSSQNGPYSVTFSIDQASYAQASFGAPRALVVIAGRIFVPVSYECSICNYSASDTATVTLPMLGEFQTKPNYGYNLSAIDFGAATETGNPYPISIYAGFPADPSPGGYGISDLTLQFSGMVDRFDWTSYARNEVSVTCRSFAALFINTKTTAQWNNMTTAAVAAELAKEHGLSADITVSNPATMQTVYNKDFVTGTQNIDEWALLQAMAEADGADVFVRGTTLYYRQRGKSTSKVVVQLDWEKNLIDVAVDHAPQFSSLVKVDVKSYSVATRSTVRSTLQGIAGQQPIPGTQRTGVSIASHSPVFGTRIVQRSGTSNQSINGLPISSSIYSSTTQQSGGSFSSGWTSMPKGPSALEYTYHANFTDTPGGLTAQAKADNMARIIWIAISSHLFHMTAHAPVTPGVEYLLNQDTIWHLDGPVPSHNLDYYGRKVDQSFSVAQDEDGDSEGWTFSVDGVNVPVVEQTV